MTNIDETKLKLVDRKDLAHDQPLPTKRVGYYQDAWNRFKKNKASAVSLIIIGIILLFTIFGPMVKTIPSVSGGDEIRMAFLTPKIPLLEKIGIFDGTRTIDIDKEFAASLPEGIIIKTVQEVVGNNGVNTRVKVDYYKYVNFTQSYYDESWQLAIRSFTQAQYDDALARNALIDLVEVRVLNSEVTYRVRVDLFRYAFDQSAEDTYFWFGTNESGKDLFNQLWNAARISILLAVAVTIINQIIGVIAGSIAGYFGGWIDIVFDRIVDILSGLPFIALLTLIVIAFGSEVWVVILAFVMTGWISTYGRTRMQFYRFKGREYVLAARTLGAKDPRIMYKHILPNAIGILITSASLSIPAFMFSEATYSYLGIIRYPDGVVSIGELLSTGQSFMQNHPHLLIFPAVYISILMLCFNLIGNGLRDAFNPSLRGTE